MKKKEFKVGEVFQCGLIKLKCILSPDASCEKCYFHEAGVPESFHKEIVGLCALGRSDGKNVHFEKVEE